jgi:RNA polymerase sigma factor (sigma-70 family)
MLGNQKEESGFGIGPETTLFTQAQAGCAESLNKIMERHEGLVHFVVQRQWLYSLEYAEALQAGRRGLWRAVLGYKPEQGLRFSTYAYQAIMRYVWGDVKSEQRRKKREAPIRELALFSYETGRDPAWIKDQQEIVESLQGLVERLPGRLRQVIEAYYGLGDKEPQTLAAIGKDLGLSASRVGGLHKEALVWLSQPAHSQALRGLVARHTQRQYELADELAQKWLRQRGGRHGER